MEGIAYHTHASMKPRYFVITPIKNIWTSKLLTVGAVYASNCTKTDNEVANQLIKNNQSMHSFRVTARLYSTEVRQKKADLEKQKS